MKREIGKQRSKAKRTTGATLFECTLLLALVAVVCVGILTAIGNRPAPMMSPVNDALAQ
jgi:Flp pilus assembly pilin Flp